jgi:hypothetical protein
VRGSANPKGFDGDAEKRAGAASPRDALRGPVRVGVAAGVIEFVCCDSGETLDAMAAIVMTTPASALWFTGPVSYVTWVVLSRDAEMVVGADPLHLLSAEGSGPITVSSSSQRRVPTTCCGQPDRLARREARLRCGRKPNGPSLDETALAYQRFQTRALAPPTSE